jgi:transposase
MVNVGIDLHKTQFTVCVRKPEGNWYKQYPTTADGYQEFLTQAAAWQAGGEEVRVGVESTGNTRYFKNRMEAAGIGITVINTMKFKVVKESANKTDKNDAATIAEFLEANMLPKSHLCSRTSEQMRRLLKMRTTLVRAQVVIKNQIHALFSAEGLEDVKSGALQSKKGRQRALDALEQRESGLVVQPMFEMIERLEEDVNSLEKQLRMMAKGDRMVELLMTIPGCGEIGAWTIRAYTDDIKRFASAKKYAAFAGLVPWVQNSNETVRHGRITKRGPQELRTALVQVVMGLRRLKAKTCTWRIMQRYEAMKQSKSHPGVKIIATARKLATIIWHMLSRDEAFEVGEMVDPKLAKKAESMSRAASLAKEAVEESKEKAEEPKEEPKAKKVGKKTVKQTGVAGEEIRKVG